MPYDIPRPYGYRIQPFKLQDDEALVASMAQQLLKARLAEARAAAGGGRGGGGGGTTHDIQCSSTVASIGTDRGNRTNAGAISKQNLQAYSYLGFTISCGGETKSFYITVNP